MSTTEINTARTKAIAEIKERSYALAQLKARIGS